MERLRATARVVKGELRVYRLLLEDRRTPRTARWLLGLAVGYAFLPFDLVPDFVPGLGHLDDLVVIPALVLLALRIVPRDLVEEYRALVRAEAEGAGPSTPPAGSPVASVEAQGGDGPGDPGEMMERVGGP